MPAASSCVRDATNGVAGLQGEPCNPKDQSPHVEPPSAIGGCGATRYSSGSTESVDGQLVGGATPSDWRVARISKDCGYVMYDRGSGAGKLGKKTHHSHLEINSIGRVEMPSRDGETTLAMHWEKGQCRNTYLAIAHCVHLVRVRHWLGLPVSIPSACSVSRAWAPLT